MFQTLARQACIHILFCLSYYIRDAIFLPDPSLCDHKVRPVRHQNFSQTECRVRVSKESQYWSWFPGYIWQPQRIKAHPVIGNGSGPFDWKIHDWIAVGTQFTVASARARRGRKEKGGYLAGWWRRRAGITLIFRPWAKEDMLTICKEYGTEAEQRFEPRQDKLRAKLIAAFLRSCSWYTTLCRCIELHIRISFKRIKLQ